jgi:hypothetical protein
MTIIDKKLDITLLSGFLKTKGIKRFLYTSTGYDLGDQLLLLA